MKTFFKTKGATSYYGPRIFTHFKNDLEVTELLSHLCLYGASDKSWQIRGEEWRGFEFSTSKTEMFESACDILLNSGYSLVEVEEVL